MRLIVLILVAALALAPLGLTGGGRGSILAVLGPFVLGFLLFSVALLLTAARWRSPRETDSEAADDRLFLARLILAGLLLRILLAVLIRVAGLNALIAPDEGTFHGNGLQFKLWLEGDSPYKVSTRFSGSLQVGYFYFLGSIYHLFGVEQILPVLVNCAVGAVTAVPVFWIARELGGREAARSSARLVTFFPSLVLWSTLLIRDSLVIFFILLIIAGVMDLRRAFSLRKLALLLLLFAGLGTLRQYIFVLVAAAATFSLLVGRAGRTGRSVVVGLVSLVSIFLLMKLVGLGLWELERVSLHQFNMQRQFNSAERFSGSILPQVDISEPSNAITYLPIGIVYFLGSPFPWQVLSPRQVMALPDVIVWYLLLPVIFTGLVSMIRTRFRDAAMLILCISLITVLYSLVEGNVGIIFRHRAQVIAPVTVLAGIGISVRKARRERRASGDAASAPVLEGAA